MKSASNKANSGFGRAKAMTPEQRSESARNAVNARWAKRTLEQRRADLTIVRNARPSHARNALIGGGEDA